MTNIVKNKKFIPLSVPVLRGNEQKYVGECIESTWVSSAGSFVSRFEKEIAAYCSSKYAVACVNGTAALHIAMIIAGIGNNEEVIVPTVTFIAPVNAVHYVGATPVFMDCDEFLNIDVDKLNRFCLEECEYKADRLINIKTQRTIKAVLPVHIFGNPVNMDGIMEVAKKYRLMVIEDAAESLGSYYKQGKYANNKTGTVGDIGICSFNGNKIITTGGGGMVFTNNEAYAHRARYLTNQAKDDADNYIHNEVGYNYRLTNIQAALGCAQLEQMNAFVEIKRKNFMLFKSKISSIHGITLIDEPPYGFANHWFYTIVVDKKSYGASRHELQQKLRKNNIECRPLWHLNHLQRPYNTCTAYNVEKAYHFADNALNIPCSVNLSEEDIDTVVDVLKNG